MLFTYTVISMASFLKADDKNGGKIVCPLMGMITQICNFRIDKNKKVVYICKGYVEKRYFMKNRGTGEACPQGQI